MKRQAKVLRISPFTYLYKSHFVQIFEISGHQLLSKSSIGISKELFTSKKRPRLSSGVRFVDVTTNGAEAVIEVIAEQVDKELVDMTAVCFLFFFLFFP